jgi:heme-degrading monooxygenase HmoA
MLELVVGFAAGAALVFAFVTLWESARAGKAWRAKMEDEQARREMWLKAHPDALSFFSKIDPGGFGS